MCPTSRGIAKALSVPHGPSNRVYGSPKSDRAVRNAIATGIPAKTKQQTDWTLRVWEQIRSFYQVRSHSVLILALLLWRKCSFGYCGKKATVDPAFQISGGTNITINIGCPQP